MDRAIRELGHRFGGVAEDAVEGFIWNGILKVRHILSARLVVVQFTGVERGRVVSDPAWGPEGGSFGGSSF